MNKQTAKRLLREQRDKIADMSNWNNAWKTQTASYIERIFGPDSQEFKHIVEFTFDLRFGFNEDRDAYNARRRRHISATETFITNCIETLEIKDVYTLPKTNFLYRLDNNWLVPLGIAIISAAWYLGYYYGVATTDYKNVDLTNKVKELRDSIVIVREQSVNRVQFALDSTRSADIDEISAHIADEFRQREGGRGAGSTLKYKESMLKYKEIEKMLNDLKSKDSKAGTR